MLTLASDGWRFFFQDDTDEMFLGNGGVELAGGRVANVIDPSSHAIVPAPDDFVSWFASHPGLVAESPQPVTVGGIVGQSIDVTNPGTADIDIFAYPTGDLRVSAGTTARLWVLPYDGPDLVFTGFARSPQFPEALPILAAGRRLHRHHASLTEAHLRSGLVSPLGEVRPPRLAFRLVSGHRSTASITIDASPATGLEGADDA